MKNVRAVQYFTDEYLEACKDLRAEHVVQFLEDFQKLHFRNNIVHNDRVNHTNNLAFNDGAVAQSEPAKVSSKLISLKVPEDLLQMFREKAQDEGIPYQTQIKKLMRAWLLGRGN